MTTGWHIELLHLVSGRRLWPQPSGFLPSYLEIRKTESESVDGHHTVNQTSWHGIETSPQTAWFPILSQLLTFAYHSLYLESHPSKLICLSNSLKHQTFTSSSLSPGSLSLFSITFSHVTTVLDYNS